MTATAAAQTLAVLARMEEAGIVPVVELGSEAEGDALVEALCAGGLPVAEITLRTEAGLGAIARLRKSHPEALIGAGTIRTPEDVERVADAGAQFVVSPGTDAEVIEACHAARIPVLPGACTPTEVGTAARAGADVIKFFPAEAMGGIAVLKALAGPFREVRFVPTGGINAVNLAAYLRLPQVAACGGSWLVDRSLIAAGRFDEIERLTREAIAIVTEVRSGG